MNATSLFDAQTAEDVRELIEDGEDVDAAFSPLHVAVIRGNAAVVAALLEAGADPGCLGGAIETTALHDAVRLDHVAIAKLLLEAGAEWDQADMNHRIAHHFVWSPVMVELLVSFGADMNVGDHDDWTPLHYCAGRSNAQESPDVALWLALIDAGADPLAQNSRGETPAEVAGDPEVRLVLTNAVAAREADRRKARTDGLDAGMAVQRTDRNRDRV